MSITTQEISPQGQVFLVRRLSLEEFAAVAEALPDDRLELINGEIVMSPPPDKTHMSLADRILELFAYHIKEIAAVGCQISGSRYYAIPKELNQQWVDEATEGPDNVCPDVSIYYSDYLEKNRRPPAPLMVEVLSVSKREHIDRDLIVKAHIYAALEIPAYWVVDRRDTSVWVHTGPSGGNYILREQYKGDQALPAPGLEFLYITARQIFERRSEP
ncbi:MAG: Uma2 family endonuclease [Blastocatellia bacterium]|nr:Uma2 family endonuclease [Blastocatellia bacterium]